ARHARVVGRGPTRADPSLRRESAAGVPLMELRIDERRLVERALRLVSTPSFTGSEQSAAELMRDELADLGLRVQWQQVEDERANARGTREGAGARATLMDSARTGGLGAWGGPAGGPTLMLNGHLDTSYAGHEPWLQGIPGFQPAGFER